MKRGSISIILLAILSLIGGASLGFIVFEKSSLQLGSQPALTTFAGGTGTSSPSGLLYGDSTIRLKTVTIGTGLTFTGGTLEASAGSGEANLGANLGIGLNLFDTKSGVTLRFNSLAAGSNITLSTTTNANTIVIASTATGGGAAPFESNTSWGSLAQATTSLLAFPQSLISSSTIGRLTVGSFTATSTVTVPAGSIAVAALAASTISGVTLGNSLSALTNDATLDGSSYNGSGAISDWGLNLANPNTWTASQFFNYATSTLFASASSTIGNLTVGSFVATSTEEKIFSITVASTSPAFIGSGQIPISSYARYEIELTQYRCWVVGGTNKVAFMTDLTNDTESITCLTTLTSDTNVATNDIFTAGELKSLEFGATSGTVDYITFEAYGFIRR